jgi:hypothetical protein
MILVKTTAIFRSFPSIDVGSLGHYLHRHRVESFFAICDSSLAHLGPIVKHQVPLTLFQVGCYEVAGHGACFSDRTDPRVCRHGESVQLQDTGTLIFRGTDRAMAVFLVHPKYKGHSR